MRRLQARVHCRVKAFAAAAGLFALLTIGALATAPPASAKSFAITSVATSARLQPDATMAVAEEVTYDFEGGPFTVGIRSFEAGSLAQITDFAVTDENGNALATTPPDESISGQWEWSFAPTSDATRTFTVTYDVVDAAAVGPDVGELYWKFLGTDHPGVGAMTVHVALPGDYPAATPTTPPTDTSVVRAWAHGPSNGVVTNNGSSVDLSVADVPAERFVEARIAVPAAAFTVTPTGSPRLPTILEQEQHFIDDREATHQRVVVGNIGAPIIAALGAGGFLLVWRRWGKEPKPPETVGDYWREPLTDPPAVVVTNLAFGTVGSAAFPSTVVDLAQRRHLTITEEHVERLGPDKVVYHFAFKSNPKDALSPYEEELLATLFRGQSATTSDDLIAWAKANHVDAEHFLHVWNENVRREVANRGYLEQGRYAKWLWWIGIAIVLGVIGVVAVALGAWVGLVAIGVAVAGLAFSSTLRRRTEKGAEKAAEAEALKRFLKDFSTLDEAPVESLAIWERYLVDAVALGVANDLIRGMALKVPQIAASPTFADWYLVSGATGRLDGIGRFNSQFGATTVAAMTPSSTGSGGGFSGGGGGGGGGGGFGAR